MSEVNDSSRWLRNFMAARLDQGTSESNNGRIEASTTGRISQDIHEHVFYFSNPPTLPASAECTSLADCPLSPAEASVIGKGSLDPDRIIEGDNKDIYPSTPILVTLTVALMMAIFMIGLDTNIIGEFIHFKGPLEPEAPLLLRTAAKRTSSQ